MLRQKCRRDGPGCEGHEPNKQIWAHGEWRAKFQGNAKWCNTEKVFQKTRRLASHGPACYYKTHSLKMCWEVEVHRKQDVLGTIVSTRPALMPVKDTNLWGKKQPPENLCSSPGWEELLLRVPHNWRNSPGMIEVDMEEAGGFGEKVSMSQKANTVVRNGKEHGLDLLFQTSRKKNNLCEDGDKHCIHHSFRFQKNQWRRVRAKVIPGL